MNMEFISTILQPASFWLSGFAAMMAIAFWKEDRKFSFPFWVSISQVVNMLIIGLLITFLLNR